MLKRNVDRIIDGLSATDRVLDVGGWIKPFNRANYVIDIMPYETRGCGGCSGQGREWFSKETWVLHDLCSRKPLPFKDNEMDFVTCSHVLEDIRDPVWVCSELMRVAKRGYVEVPSRLIEQTMGVEDRNYAGYFHHRWLVDIEANRIIFHNKSPLVHAMWQCHFPSSFLKRIRGAERVSWLFFEGDFDALEMIQMSKISAQREFMRFVNKHYQYPKLYYLLDSEYSGQIPRTRLKKAIKMLLQCIPGFRSIRRLSPSNVDIRENRFVIESRTDT